NVAADSPNNRFAQLPRAADPRGEITQALHRQNVRQRSEIVFDRSAFDDRLREVFDGDLARPRSQRVSADLIEIDWFQIVVNRHVLATVSEARPLGRATNQTHDFGNEDYPC